MLHLLLTVLKIILIVLAAVVGLVVLVLIAALFVPVRYSVFAQKSENVSLKAGVTWLLHLISVPVTYDGSLDIRVKVFGFTVLNPTAAKTGRGADGSADEGGGMDADGRSDAAGGTGTGGSVDVPGGRKNAGGTDADGAADDSGGSAGGKISRAKKDKAPKKERKKKKKEPEAEATEADRAADNAIPGRIKGLILGLRDRISGIFEKLQGILKKAGDIKRLVFDERTKQAVKLVLAQAGHLLKKLAPKKLSGRVRFGMPDPSTTGEILAGLGFLYPVVADRLEVVPDFEEEVLEGEICLEGYFRLVTIVVIAFRVIRDKNARFVIKKLAG